MFENLFSDFSLTIGMLDSIKVTMIMSVCSTVISSFLGVFFAIMLEKHDFRGKKLIVRINRTLMGAPPVVVGLVTYMLLRKKGPLGDLRWVFTIKGMIVAQTLIITPIICGMVYSYLVRTAPKIRAFAKTMGADKWQTDMLILKEIKNEIYFSIVSGYGRSISEVGAVMLVGGNIRNRTRTMTTAISTLKSAGEFEAGVVLGILLMIMAFAVQTFADMIRKETSEDENY